MKVHSWWVLVVLCAVWAAEATGAAAGATGAAARATGAAEATGAAARAAEAAAGATGAAAGDDGVVADNTTEAPQHSGDEDMFVKVFSDHCSKKYSLTCLKVDAVRLVDRLAHTAAYRLLPGISLVHSNYSSLPAVPVAVLVELVAQGNVTAVDELVTSRLTDYLHSLTLAVKLLDTTTVSRARRLSEQMILTTNSHSVTARKKGGGGAMLAVALMAALGLAALAALAGKAMMTSMLALMMAAAGAMRGGAGGGVGGGGGGDCSGYGFSAARRNIVVQDRPAYRPPFAPNFTPSS